VKQIFSDDRITVEDILAKKGEMLKKKKVTVTGGGDDLEFWDDDDLGEMQRALGKPRRHEPTPPPRSAQQSPELQEQAPDGR
jgi:hypothetical protein